MTLKQETQLLREAEALESLKRGDELESPFIVLMRICRDYARTLQPFYNEADRMNAQRRLIERLDKFRTKYFEKI